MSWFTWLCTDASRQGSGLILHIQLLTGQWILVQAGSRLLIEAESQYRRVPFFKGYKFCEWCKKGDCGNYFHEWHWWCAPPLFTIATHEHKCATRLAMLKDIMADRLTEERFCGNKISYLQWINWLPSLAAKPTCCLLIRSCLSILISSWSITW